MTDKVALNLPSIEDLLRVYITHVLAITESKIETANILDIKPSTLNAKIKKLGIECKRKPGRKSEPLKVNMRNTGKLPPSISARKRGVEVTYTVDPEERDYYYNLDFLCGVDRKSINHSLELDPSLD